MLPLMLYQVRFVLNVSVRLFSFNKPELSQYLSDECSDFMQEAISGATATIIYGLRIVDYC